MTHEEIALFKEGVFKTIDTYINKLLELRKIIRESRTFEEMDKALTEHQDYLKQEFPKVGAAKKTRKKNGE